jgi:hypothetical protein
LGLGLKLLVPLPSHFLSYAAAVLADEVIARASSQLPELINEGASNSFESAKLGDGV